MTDKERESLQNENPRRRWPCLVLLVMLTLLTGAMLSLPPAAADLDPDEDPDNDGYDYPEDSLGWINFTNKNEFDAGTNPKVADTDGDGIDDGWEVHYRFDPNDDSDADDDPDNDNKTNLAEFLEGTNPRDRKSSGPGPSGGDTPSGSKPDSGGYGPVTDIQIFQPALGSLKRGSSVDAVYFDANDDFNPYLVTLWNDTRYQIYPTNTSDYNFIFDGWYWNGLSVSKNSYTRIDSVAPDADIISFDPNDANFSINFYKDYADNFYVRVDPSSTNDSGIIYLRFFMGTNGSYFDLDVPSRYNVSDPAIAKILRPLKPDHKASEIESRVKEVLMYNESVPELYNLWNDDYQETNVAKIVHNLSSYFLAFDGVNEPDAPDRDHPDGLDQWQQLVVGGKGACRHRAISFTIIANTLGVPTRYITNYVHAFVEVYIPDGSGNVSSSHWQRINLGGASVVVTNNPRPDDDGTSDEFGFGDGSGSGGNNPGDELNMTGVPVEVHLTGLTPTIGDKGETLFVATGYVGNDTRRYANHSVGLGFWDLNHTADAIELATGQTNATGDFIINFTLPLSVPRAWNELYAASYEKGLLGVSDPLLFEVAAASTITANVPPTVGQGGLLVVSGSLADIGGLIAPNETLWLHLDSPVVDMGYPVTDELGGFYFEYQVPSGASEGDYVLNITFNGSTYLHGSHLLENFSVMKGSVNLTGNVSPDTQFMGRTLWVNGTTDGDVVNKAELVLYLAGQELVRKALTATPFDLSATLPTDLAPGLYNMTLSFEPTTDHRNNYPQERLLLEFNLTGPVELSVDELTATRGQDSTLTGRLTDHLGAPMVGAAVDLSWDGTFLATVTTTGDGTFGHTFTVAADEVLGPLPVEASFAGDRFHLAGQANNSAAILEQTRLDLDPVDPGFAFIGERVNVTGTFTMDNGSVLEGTLWYRVDGSPLGSLEANDGTFTFNLTLPDAGWLVGEHVFTVEYLGEGDHLAVLNVTSFVLMKRVSLTISGSQVFRDQDLTLSGKAVDETGSHIPGLVLELSWDSQVLTSSLTTDALGQYSYLYTVPYDQQLGELTVEVVFDNTSQPYYTFAAANATYTVVTEITLEIDYLATVDGAGKVYRDSTIKLGASILDDQARHPDDELNLNFYWAGESLGRATSQLGYASVSKALPADNRLGSHEYKVIFAGFGYYLPATVTTDYYVWANTTTTLTEFDTPRVVGQTLEFQGTATNDQDQGLDGNLSVLWDGNLLMQVQVVNGVFADRFKADSHETARDHNLTVVWRDTGEYLEESRDWGTVVVRRPTTMTVNPGEDAKRNTTLLITGRLLDHLDEGVEGALVNLYWDEQPIGNATTDNLGVWSRPYQLPADTLLGYHNVSASYPETTYYLASQGRARWEVTTLTTLIYDSGRDIDRVSPFQVRFQLLDDLGQGLAGRNLTLQWPGLANVTLITDDQGQAQQNLELFDAHPLGPVNSNVTYDGEPFIYGDMAWQTYTVWANTSIRLTMPDTVMAGSQVHFNGTFLDDVGTNMNGLIEVIVAGATTWYAEVPNGSFSGVYFISSDNEAGHYPVLVIFAGRSVDHYFASNASMTLTVQQDSEISMSALSGYLNTTLLLEGRMQDNAGNPVGSAQLSALQLTFDEEPLDFTVEPLTLGHFQVALFFPYSQPVGEHQLTMTFQGDDLYTASSASVNLSLKARTAMTVEVPTTAQPGQFITARVTLTLEDGTPLPSARMLVWLYGADGNTTNQLLVTDDQGLAKFVTDYTGTADADMRLRVAYNGDNHHDPVEMPRSIGYRPLSQTTDNTPLLLAGVLVAVASGGGLYLALQYRQRHLRQVKDIITTTADALEAGQDYNATIYESYVQLCKVLHHFGYLRQDHETAREFAQALEAALTIEPEPLYKLTGLYEVVDYSKHEMAELDRDEAIAYLRAAETALNQWQQQGVA